MFRYALAAASLFAATTAFAQDSHDISLQIEATTGVDVTGLVDFQWFAPPAGSPYSTNPDSGSQSVTVSYTSSGEGGLHVEATDDPTTRWGIEVTVTPDPPACGSDLGSQTLTTGSQQIIDFTGFGTCADSVNVNYDASIVDESLFSATNSGDTITVTYTLF